MAGDRGPRRVLLLGATGTIGRAAAAALVARGHAVVAPVRPGAAAPPGVEARALDLASPGAWARDGIRGDRFDAVLSCLASRTGAPRDAWAIDHDAHLEALGAAEAAGIPRWVQLSAICVQKPRLAFQHAKQAFEDRLLASGLDAAVVRPTAYFKSLSGQVARAAAGKPFLVFGDGRRTACKPISDRDLAAYLVDRIESPGAAPGVRPIGGPGPALTPLDQAAMLARLLGRPVPVRRIPMGVVDAAAAALGLLGRASRRWADRAEFARTARYYASESMLVWDAVAGRYDADATPETGADTLETHYARLLAGVAADDRGAHALF